MSGQGAAGAPALLPALRTVEVTRYVTPLREGGSLPAIVEADDLGTYVLKFRAAAQGPKVLIAELVAGEIGRALGLPVPEIVFANLDPTLGRSEPHAEIRETILASGGLNLAMDFLPGALPFDPAVPPRPEPELAAAIVWFDAFVTNVDRTARNTNLLLWHKKLHLIDQGAALYVHYNWPGFLDRAGGAFPQIRDHVLLPFAADIGAADERLRPLLSEDLLAAIVAQIPDDWLGDEPAFATPDEQRGAYLAYLCARLAAPRRWVEEAERARAQFV